MPWESVTAATGNKASLAGLGVSREDKAGGRDGARGRGSEMCSERG